MLPFAFSLFAWTGLGVYKLRQGQVPGDHNDQDRNRKLEGIRPASVRSLAGLYPSSAIGQHLSARRGKGKREGRRGGRKKRKERKAKEKKRKKRKRPETTEKTPKSNTASSG